jgi:alkanesulfonate monooxygenase SsuD/methylene tetrahydromethanopterin reductase-like flavin-dependent oxidoreductase (luciferase family)
VGDGVSGAYEALRRHCETIGRHFEEIVLTCGIPVHLPDDPAAFKPTYEHSFYPGSVFHVLGPTPSDVIREIEQLVDVGVRHFQVSFEDMPTYRRFVREVVPVVRLERGS